MTSRPLILVCYLIVLLFAVAGCGPDQRVHKYTYFAFGTIIELTISGTNKTLANQAAKTLQTDFEQMHKDWHAWLPGPLVDLNNKIARGQPAKVDDKLLPLLLRAKQLATQSSGIFNPGLGGLLDIWGYESDQQPTEPPDQKIIEKFLQAMPKTVDYDIREGVLTSRNPSLQFDLGGFAKGHGLDLAIKRLREMGVENAIINAGGDLKVIGQRHDRLWRVGIRHPRKADMLSWINVQPGESVFTSGDYERYFMFKGKRYHHILDPRTGYPADKTISVTIVHEDAGLADAAATALFVAGPNEWQEIATQMGIDQAMLIDARGKIWQTPALATRMKLTEQRIDVAQHEMRQGVQAEDQHP